MEGSISATRKSMQGKQDSENGRILPVAGSDPRWRKWTKPLLHFLSEPRNIQEISDFCIATHGVAHSASNLLAWLENERLVFSKRISEKVYLWCTKYFKLQMIPDYHRELDTTIAKQRKPFRQQKPKKKGNDL